jgi:hypothetical protein
MCREVTIPAGGLLRLSYGLHPARAEKAVGLRGAVRFTASLKADGGHELLVEDRTIDPLEGELWYETKVSLAEYAHRTVELCLDAQGVEGLADRQLGDLPLWEVPLIRPARRAEADMPSLEQKVSAREKMLLEQQLKALGYME